MAERRLVAPELLRYIDDYLEETNINDAVREDELDSDSNLIVFYRELFAQLFANVVAERITGIGQRSGERARELYERHGSEWSVPLRSLVREFQHFCKLYPDLLGAAYGGGNEAVVDLHFGLLPGLLHKLKGWAELEGDEALVEATEQARRRYGQFLDDFEPGEL